MLFFSIKNRQKNELIFKIPHNFFLASERQILLVLLALILKII